MALFLETFELEGRNPETFADARSDEREGIVCLRHWVSKDGRSIALLVEARSEEALRRSRSGATEVAELFAPAERWLGCDAVRIA